MKNYNARKVLFLYLLFCNSCYGSTISFAEVFDRTIYDQNTPLVQVVPMDHINADTPEETRRLREQTLAARELTIKTHIPQARFSDADWSKIIRLYQIKSGFMECRMIQHLQRNVNIYQAILGEIRAQRESVVEIGRTQGGAGVAGGLLATAVHGALATAGWIANPASRVMGLIERIPHMMGGVSAVTNSALQGEAAARAAALSGNDREMERLIREKNTEIQRIKDSLFVEPVHEYEIGYVLRKRGYEAHDGRLCNEIESALISRRKQDIPHVFIDEFLNKALRLAIVPRNLRERNGALNVLLARADENIIFSNFADNVRGDLRALIRHIYHASLNPDDSEVPLRKSYYLWGNPGCGKSTCAEELPKFLGLPYFVTTTKTQEDLSRGSLEGGDWKRPKAMAGWLAETLLTSVSPDDKMTYLNGFLIINDFDRILLDPAVGNSALAFFLDYLDPNKREFCSPYFEANINISRMPIIITANSDIPDTPNFRALRDRLNVIHFPDLADNVAIDVVLPNYLRHLINFCGLVGINAEKARTLVQLSKASSKTNSIREYKKKLENLVGQVEYRGYVDAITEWKANMSQVEIRPAPRISSYDICKMGTGGVVLSMACSALYYGLQYYFGNI